MLPRNLFFKNSEDQSKLENYYFKFLSFFCNKKIRFELLNLQLFLRPKKDVSFFPFENKIRTILMRHYQTFLFDQIFGFINPSFV